MHTQFCLWNQFLFVLSSSVADAFVRTNNKTKLSTQTESVWFFPSALQRAQFELWLSESEDEQENERKEKTTKLIKFV